MPSRTNKFRGRRTHGRGKKSGRGAGKMGGHGNAGLLKHKFMWVLKTIPSTLVVMVSNVLRKWSLPKYP